jgi:peptidoglycan/LPS O-acetylase OafA/YrhL
VNVPPAVCAAALLGVLLLPGSSTLPAVLNLALVLLVFPAILWVGASSSGGPRVTRIAGLLGTASYAVYVLHIPVGDFFGKLWRLALHRPMEAARPWSGVIFVVLLFPLMLWLDRVYDQPVRAWLKRLA